MRKGALAYPIPFWLLAPLALLAGAAAMLHVVAELEAFSILYGFGVATKTVVLATFLGGFAIGAIVVGLRADNSQHPLRWFGLLQIGLGFFALGAPTLAAMLGEAPPRMTHALALLLLPGLLAGGSAPVLVRASAHTTGRGALAVGTIASATALGAALALPLAGAPSLLGVALPIAAGALAWALSLPAGKREIFGSDGEHIRIGWTGDAGFPVLFGLVVVGAILPVQRFAWYRLLPYALDAADPAATGFLLHLAGLGAEQELQVAPVEGLRTVEVGGLGDRRDRGNPGLEAAPGAGQ